MWILVKKTFAGKLAGQSMLLVVDTKYDLPKNRIEQLRKEIGEKNVIDTCAPWEEHVDQKAAKAAELKAKANAAINKVRNLVNRLEILKTNIAAGNKEYGKLKMELKDAKEEAETLAKKAGIDWSPCLLSKTEKAPKV